MKSWHPHSILGGFRISFISLDSECISFSMGHIKIQLLAALGFVLLHINRNQTSVLQTDILMHFLLCLSCCFLEGSKASKTMHNGPFHYQYLKFFGYILKTSTIWFYISITEFSVSIIMLFIPMLFISGIVVMKETGAHAMTPDGQLGPRS